MKTRAAAARVLHQVVDQGQSLSQALPQAQQSIPAKDRALLQEMCYGVLRWLPRLDFIARQLLSKPLKSKQRSVHFLILVGLYQLIYMRTPPHAAVAETVAATQRLKAPMLKGLVNAVLRNFQRQQEELEAKADEQLSPRTGHPGWLLKRLQAAYPEQWEQVVDANNQRPPMWLRANASRQDRADYQQRLTDSGIESRTAKHAQQAICLERPMDVEKLPGFGQGDSSVQDAAAQMAAQLLDAQPGDLILDACAAPGGKTAHVLELQPEIREMIAVDFDATRLARVQENLDRIGLKARLIHADASKPEQWWQEEDFDRILLDAPCSATGVIRRHPDIKWLRRNDDISELAGLQQAILRALWQRLKPGGTLVYATCSVLPDENKSQIKAFLADTQDAELLPLHPDDTPENPGWQILPGEDGMDGFYYAKLKRLA